MLTAIEVTAHVPPVINLDYLHLIFELSKFQLWFSSFAAALFLKVLQMFIHNQMLVPMFYASIPILFYLVVFMAGLSLDSLRQSGWLFSFEGGTDVPFYVFWTYFDFSKVSWSAVASTLPTQLALTFFGILHVPINGTSFSHHRNH